MDELMQMIFTECRQIAVVGLSPKPERPSHYVSRYLQLAGYRIIPVNPGHTEILGEPCYANLAEVPTPLDWVLCFRPSEAIPPLAAIACANGAKALWMQMGITHPAAAEQARAHGLWVIEDRCAMVEHRRLHRH